MNIIMLGLYDVFECIADKCPSTCCSGWKIVVDDESYNRFSSLENVQLRVDILSNIKDRDGEKSFINRHDGRCSMLDDNGLCRIQRNSSEETLCNTCRKFPRLISANKQPLMLSMAASCPVVAEYILHDRVSFIKRDNNGKKCVVCREDMPEITEETDSLRYLICEKLKRKKNAVEYFEIYKKCIDMASFISEAILSSPHIKYLASSLDYYESDYEIEKIIMDVLDFEEKVSDKYFKFIENYISYRIFSRYLEMPEETAEERKIQVTGELFMIYTIYFSKFFTDGKLEDDYVVKCICWAYRFCAHEKKLGQKTHEKFKSMFKIDD